MLDFPEQAAAPQLGVRNTLLEFQHQGAIPPTGVRASTASPLKRSPPASGPGACRLPNN